MTPFTQTPTLPTPDDAVHSDSDAAGPRRPSDADAPVRDTLDVDEEAAADAPVALLDVDEEAVADADAPEKTGRGREGRCRRTSRSRPLLMPTPR